MKKYLSTIFRLWKLLTPFHRFLYFQIVFIFVIQLTGTAFTILFAKIINALIAKDIHTLYILVALFPLISIIAIIANYLSDRNEVKNLDSSVQQYLEEFSFKKIFSLNAFQYLESHSAIKLQVINRGENSVQTIIELLSLQGLPTIFSLVISLVAISYYSLPIGIWTGITFIALLYATNKFNTYFSPLMKKNMDNWDNQRKVRTEAFSHLLLIKLSGQEGSYLKKYLSRRFSIVGYAINIWTTNAQYINLRNLFIYFSRFVSLVLVIILFIQGHTTVGVVYAIFSWTTSIYNNIGSLNNIFRQLPLRFIEVEKYLDTVDQVPVFKEEQKNRYKSGNIEFKDVTFKYPAGEKDVLHKISFTIPSGQKVAFVGHSGSGKSTITRLLLRMYEWKSGDIFIGGKSIREIDTKDLRHNIGYVEQHVDLFDDSIKENILFAIPEKKYKVAGKNLDAVVGQARIDQFFARLGEKKLDTTIGEHGVKLSGGERQRIGIARAIIKDPEILIFDEATSSLDSENEKYVMEAINDVSKGKTTIIIAHRLSTVRNADKIIVMDKGTIAGVGTHEELMQTSPIYQNLVAHQLS